jgi:hypothetical protein
MCAGAVVLSYLLVLLPVRCSESEDGSGLWQIATWFGNFQRMFADQSLPKCSKTVNIADAMVQMISVRTKIAVWIFLLIGTWFIYEIEENEIRRFASEHGSRVLASARTFLHTESMLQRLQNWLQNWSFAFARTFLHTESMLQRLQNLSSVLLFPCAVSMFGLHAMQQLIWSDSSTPAAVLGWLTYWEYFMSICLTGCFM